jgi:phospholipid transport system substrate-binding protein
MQQQDMKRGAGSVAEKKSPIRRMPVRSVRAFLCAFSSVLIVGVIGHSRATAEEYQAIEAKQFISDFGNRAIEALTNPQISATARQERFAALLKEGFDTKTIGRFVLGLHWRRLTKDQKQKFITLFQHMITLNYAARFKEFAGVVMQVKSAECVAQGGVNVDTSVTLPRGGQATIVWKMFPGAKGKGFRVTDVVIDNISMSITQRSEFAHSIQESGDDMDAFLAELEKRVKQTEQASLGNKEKAA